MGFATGFYAGFIMGVMSIVGVLLYGVLKDEE